VYSDDVKKQIEGADACIWYVIDVSNDLRERGS